ncbi:Retrovirus-related Pol polyprotein from transposon 17.6, partial [Mucuna pruriens]
MGESGSSGAKDIWDDYCEESVGRDRYVRLYQNVVLTIQCSEYIPEVYDHHLLGSLGDCMEVFMDDFTMYTKSFDACLNNLSRVLHRCMETNLVLNFEKCHFMVIEGIVLGHLVSSRGFYQRFIKNFSKITLPLSKLLQKDVDFVFDQPCVDAFQVMKKRLMSAPILQAPNWEYLFELMCDVSNSMLGAVLGQRVDKQPHVIAYASRTMDPA